MLLGVNNTVIVFFPFVACWWDGLAVLIHIMCILPPFVFDNTKTMLSCLCNMSAQEKTTLKLKCNQSNRGKIHKSYIGRFAFYSGILLEILLNKLWSKEEVDRLRIMCSIILMLKAIFILKGDNICVM